MSDLIERQVIINKLESWLKADGYSEGELNMLKAVLFELQCMPSAQPGLNEWCTDCKEYNKEKHHCPRFNRVIREALKDAKPEHKPGHWETYIISMLDGEGCKCSECGFEGVPYWDFCPNCGADMRGKQND